MKLNIILNDIAVKEVIGDRKREIDSISYDSRSVKDGSLFVAVRGFKSDGHKFINDAVVKGASAIVLEDKSFVEYDKGVTWIIVEDSRKSLAFIGANFYGNPSANMKVIGITGTNGKTTLTFLLERLFQQVGLSSGRIGTISIKIGDQVIPSRNTTPESLDLQAYLAAMCEKNLDYAVMEVSSHALALDRCLSVDFDTAVFTNLTQDHLDFHKDMEDYYLTKLKIFKQIAEHSDENGRKKAVINVDDPYGKRMAEYLQQFPKQITTITYAVDNQADIKANNVHVAADGVSFDVVSDRHSMGFRLQLSGLFNVYNCLAAIGVGISEKIDLSDIKAAMESIEAIPGRFEKINCGQDYTVVVDYAHTPDGLKNVLETVKEFAAGDIITVFGCGGERDKGKRPKMGKLAAEYSDLVIVTSDNPRGEDPMQIIEDIAAGINESVAAGKITQEKVLIEPDRHRAIELAVNSAKADDVVIIAGKGHETYQILNDRTIDCDDRLIAREYIMKRSVLQNA